eukprot:scaffold131793_cov48-Phaeocystis_antarctica.AAC.1
MTIALLGLGTKELMTIALLSCFDVVYQCRCHSISREACCDSRTTGGKRRGSMHGGGKKQNGGDVVISCIRDEVSAKLIKIISERATTRRGDLGEVPRPAAARAVPPP